MSSSRHRHVGWFLFVSCVYPLGQVNHLASAGGIEEKAASCGVRETYLTNCRSYQNIWFTHTHTG